MATEVESVQAKRKRDYGDGSVRPHGKSWIGRFWYEGKRIEPNLGKLADLTEKQARAKLRNFMAAYKPADVADRITVGILCDKYLAHREADPDLALNSLESIRSTVRVHIKPEFEKRIADTLTAEELERFQAKKLKTAKPKSVKIWMSTMHSILEYGRVKLKVLPSNVAKEVKKIKAQGRLDITILDTDEIAAIREALLADKTFGDQDSVMALVASRSGLRQGELISVRVRNLDFKTGWIRVVTSYERTGKKHKAPKGKKTRALPMSDEVRGSLLDHLGRSQFNGPDDLVFGHPLLGTELDGSALLDRFKAAVIRAGVRRGNWEKRTYKTSRGKTTERWFSPIRFHDLRHAAATWWASRGVPGYIIEEWAGWADAETMKLYLHYRTAGFELDLLNAASEPVPNLSPIHDQPASAGAN